LNLQLFDLRREPILREARSCFLNEFNPESFNEFIELVRSDRASFRMVIGYWDMAASLVTSGAIDGDAFRAGHGEAILTRRWEAIRAAAKARASKSTAKPNR
jgi:hypothetical protein